MKTRINICSAKKVNAKCVAREKMWAWYLTGEGGGGGGGVECASRPYLANNARFTILWRGEGSGRGGGGGE